MNHYVKTVSPNVAGKNSQTSPSKPIPGRESEMVANSGGGFSFQLDEWGYLDRFLILGSDRPSYASSARDLTMKASENVMKCIKLDGVRTVARITELSEAGRAPKNDPAVFALALCAIHGDAATVQAAYASLSKVCRIGTHLFQFVSALDAMGKWNAAAKRGVAAWYTARRDDRLAVQFLKYASRDGWSHRDVLRLAHVKPTSDTQAAMFKQTTQSTKYVETSTEKLPALYAAVEQLKKADVKSAIKLIEANKDITWEMMPTELQREVGVWEALLPNMGLTALIRKLGQLTNIGLIKPLSSGSKLVISKITDTDAIKNAKVHPALLLNAYKQYGVGHGDKGTLTWSPDQRVRDALNDAFYDAFQYVPSTGQGIFFGIDVSGSMTIANCMGLSNLTACEAAGVLAMAVAKRESNYFVGGFATNFVPLNISPTMRLEAVCREIQKSNFGSTNPGAAINYAKAQKMSGVDKFVIITDNDVNSGRSHPVEALRDYRKAYNRNTKMVVVGTSVTDFTIADPKDPGMLDIAGFDSAVPQLIQTF